MWARGAGASSDGPGRAARGEATGRAARVIKALP